MFFRSAVFYSFIVFSLYSVILSIRQKNLPSIQNRRPHDRDIPAMRLAGYEPKRLAFVDMFPFTKNTEAVCLFERETEGTA